MATPESLGDPEAIRIQRNLQLGLPIDTPLGPEDLLRGETQFVSDIFNEAGRQAITESRRTELTRISDEVRTSVDAVQSSLSDVFFNTIQQQAQEVQSTISSTDLLSVEGDLGAAILGEALLRGARVSGYTPQGPAVPAGYVPPSALPTITAQRLAPGELAAALATAEGRAPGIFAQRERRIALAEAQGQPLNLGPANLEAIQDQFLGALRPQLPQVLTDQQILELPTVQDAVIAELKRRRDLLEETNRALEAELNAAPRGTGGAYYFGGSPLQYQQGLNVLQAQFQGQNVPDTLTDPGLGTYYAGGTDRQRLQGLFALQRLGAEPTDLQVFGQDSLLSLSRNIATAETPGQFVSRGVSQTAGIGASHLIAGAVAGPVGIGLAAVGGAVTERLLGGILDSLTTGEGWLADLVGLSRGDVSAAEAAALGDERVSSSPPAEVPVPDLTGIDPIVLPVAPINIGPLLEFPDAPYQIPIGPINIGPLIEFPDTPYQIPIGPIDIGPLIEFPDAPYQIPIGPIDIGPLIEFPDAPYQIPIGPIDIGPLIEFPDAPYQIPIGPINIGPLIEFPDTPYQIPIGPIDIGPLIEFPDTPYQIPIGPINIGPLIEFPDTPYQIPIGPIDIGPLIEFPDTPYQIPVEPVFAGGDILPAQFDLTGREGGVWPTLGPLTINFVLDGETLVQAVIPSLEDAIEEGELVIEGVIG